MAGIFQTAGAFTSTLYHTRAGLSPERFAAWQDKKLRLWLDRDLPKVDFYSQSPATLSDLPIIDKSTVMAQFEAFTQGKITAEKGWAAYDSNDQIGKVSIGASTGTSGNRSLYAVTQAEQFRWLGVILAKTLPRFISTPERVAIILPQNASLYETATKTHRIALKFFDLRAGVEVWGQDLQAFDPTTIVAPPRVLRHLAETLPNLRPRRLFAGAETLDPIDRQVIEAHFGLLLGQIYMATEGLFAVSCAHHQLHLAEDVNFFELEPVGEGLHSPIITSFQRRFQIMARYRMNDLLRLGGACACGSPLRVVKEVVGRMDDVFTFGKTLITPDILRNAVLAAARNIIDFRVHRHANGAVSLLLPQDLPDASAQAALNALDMVFKSRGVLVDLTLARQSFKFEPGQKLRRVENKFSAEGTGP